MAGNNVPATAAFRNRNQGMNGLERSYAARLRMLMLAGEVEDYWFECVNLRIGHKCHYRPDFLVQLPSGEMQIHETKGFMMDDALVKIKAVAAKYPFRLIVVRYVRGEWTFEHIKSV